MKKTIIAVSFLLIAGVSVWYFVTRDNYKTPEWKTTIIDTGAVAVNVTATGALNAVTTVQVGAQVSGIVSRLFADFNSVVTKGQVVAMLDTTLLYAAMCDAAAAVEKAKVQTELAKKQFIRTDTLFRAKVAAQADYDLAYSNFRSAEADLKARIAALSHEKTNLRYATIKAPINGTVISRNVDVGQTVISSFNAPTLFTIANDLTQMQVLANVDEADIGQVKVGQSSVFTVDAYPYEKFEGVVAMIRLQPVVVQNVNNYVVVINVPNPDLKLLPGLTANITISIKEHRGVMKVPINAVHFTPPADYLQAAQVPDYMLHELQKKKVAGNEVPRVGDSCYIWLADSLSLKPVRVRAGIFDGTSIEISGRVTPGDLVVTGVKTAVAGESKTTNNPFMPKMPPRRMLR